MNSFKRGLTSKDALNIGMGPGRFIPDKISHRAIRPDSAIHILGFVPSGIIPIPTKTFIRKIVK